MLTLDQRLAEAETAYHDLVIGKAAVRVRDADGSEIQYTQATRGALRDYIADLKLQIANALNGSSTAAPGPMRMIF